MRNNDVLFFVGGLFALTGAAILAAYGIHLVNDFLPSPEYPNCRMLSGNCGLISTHVGFLGLTVITLAGIGIAAVAQAVSMPTKRTRRRN